MTPPPPSPRSNLGQQLARASWMAPIIAVGVGICSGLGRRATGDEQLAGLIVAIINLTILFAGGVVAIIALVGMRKWGRERVLAPAAIGLGLFVFFSLAFVATMSAARRARQVQQQQQQSQQQQKPSATQP